MSTATETEKETTTAPEVIQPVAVEKPPKGKTKTTKKKGKRGRPAKAKKPKEDPTTLTPYFGNTAVSIWEDAASVYVPVLKASMSADERREAVRDVMKATSSMDDRLNLVAGEMLYEISRNGYWKEWEFTPEGASVSRKYETFEEYCECEHELKKRKAQYLKSIYEKFVVELELDVDTLRDLEWSKAKELQQIITKKTAAALLAKTKDWSLKKIQEHVRKVLGKTSPSSTPDENRVKIVFKCTAEQSENIYAALDFAKSMSKSDILSTNLDLICSDFLAGSSEKGLAGVMGKLDVIVANLERSFGVKIKIDVGDTERFEQLQKEAAEAEEAGESEEEGTPSEAEVVAPVPT